MTEKTPMRKNAQNKLATGVAAIKSHHRNLAANPGVYRMINAKGDILYVGKARNLKSRVAAYTRPQQLPIRLQRMIAETARMEFTIAQSEAEALLLEAVLIKKHMPRYNIQLRDDKSFPYIAISKNHAFARIYKHRGARGKDADYFGPYMTASGAVDQTIASMQRAFLIRNCSDSIFRDRTRPCLQYHIKRCSAPCVNYINAEDYKASVGLVKDFLRGKTGQVQELFAEKMAAASKAMDFESAAQYRDRIRALAIIQSRQRVLVHGLGDIDIIAAAQKASRVCVAVFSYRDDQHLGNYSYFPKTHPDQTLDEVIAAFLTQYYAEKPIPKEIVVSHAPKESVLIARALSLQSGHKVDVSCPARGKKHDIVDHALKNAADQLNRAIAERASQKQLLQQLADAFGLPTIPERIEIYDNSHIQGKSALGVMVVATPDGFQKKSYRKFTIRADQSMRQNHGGDDYAMLRQVLRRRFARIGGDAQDTSAVMPDLLLIDGGMGQLNAALDVLRELDLSAIPVIAIAKGPDRNAGRERFFMDGRTPMQFPSGNPVLHFTERLRDEAHRFAIGGHRKKRTAEMGRSALDAIAGIGSARKRSLLRHFGSAIGVKKASLQDLQAVKGISQSLAQLIYSHFHSGAE